MNVTLTGMSGVGKSYIGKHLAKALGYSFVDTDETLEKQCGMQLQEILDAIGPERFIEKEARIVCSLVDISNTVIAPGGSIVYSNDAVEFLKENSFIVYLFAHPGVIEGRTDTTNRGIVGLTGKTFRQLYDERSVLYERSAHVKIDTTKKRARTIVEEIMELI